MRQDEYYRFITSDNEALRLELFESNVRDYAGSTAVNNAIGEPLKLGTGEDFWWCNNGVTVVADAAQIAGTGIVLEKPQIVNGLDARALSEADERGAVVHLDAVVVGAAETHRTEASAEWERAGPAVAHVQSTIRTAGAAGRTSSAL
ncbi:AIPR family protein [Streptomyces sp. NPDC053750]|uniref:AIPR family protein n=1 Tax=Streptomyces sp. NPDC053750 TaxID=3365714 RepID=UPI0037D06940